MRDMVINIVMKFADVLDATGLAARDRMKHAPVGLRDAEAGARALVLAMALTLVAAPMKKIAAPMRTKPRAATKPLFRFRCGVSRSPRPRETVEVLQTLASREHIVRLRAEDAYS